MNSRLKTCWNLAKRDREKYSPFLREAFDKVFLDYIERCDWDGSDLRGLEADIGQIVQTIDNIQLKFCWDLTERERDSYSPYLREAFDKMFLDYLSKCDWRNTDVKSLESDLNFIVQSIEDIQYKPREPFKDSDSTK